MPEQTYITKRASELEHGDVAVSWTSGEPLWAAINPPWPYVDSEHLTVFVQYIPSGEYDDLILRHDDKVRVQHG